MFASNSIYFEIHTNNDVQVHWLTQIIMDYINQFPWIGVLVLLMILDIITGVIAAAINKTVSSEFSSRGILKKVQMIVLVGVGLIFEIVHPELPWGKLIAMLFIANEMISITENAGRAGLPLPKQLLDVLAKSKEHHDDGESQTVRIEVLETKEIKEPEKVEK